MHLANSCFHSAVQFRIDVLFPIQLAHRKLYYILAFEHPCFENIHDWASFIYVFIPRRYSRSVLQDHWLTWSSSRDANI